MEIIISSKVMFNVLKELDVHNYDVRYIGEHNGQLMMQTQREVTYIDCIAKNPESLIKQYDRCWNHLMDALEHIPEQPILLTITEYSLTLKLNY